MASGGQIDEDCQVAGPKACEARSAGLEEPIAGW
jgi:hypothetical protein